MNEGQYYWNTSLLKCKLILNIIWFAHPEHFFDRYNYQNLSKKLPNGSIAHPKFKSMLKVTHNVVKIFCSGSRKRFGYQARQFYGTGGAMDW